MSENDDISELLTRLVLKDRSAFNQLYDATSAKLFGVCLRIVGERSTAEDAMQEIYVKIWNKADRFRPGDASPMSWIFAIARNHCIDIIRARRNTDKPIEVVLDLAEKSPGPEAMAVNSSEGRRIEKCLSELENKKAAAVKAAYVEGYSYVELADFFEVPLNTMRTWLRRSLIALRKCLEN